jgi:hypothetical protein
MTERQMTQHINDLLQRVAALESEKGGKKKKADKDEPEKATATATPTATGTPVASWPRSS